jgi:starvation-inducible DNA-binding protein
MALPGVSHAGQSHEMQPFGSVVPIPIGLAEGARRDSADNLNQLLADTITVRDLYKRHHWQVYGPDFYPRHLMLDKHFGEQNDLVDMVCAEGDDHDYSRPTLAQ